VVLVKIVDNSISTRNISLEIVRIETKSNIFRLDYIVKNKGSQTIWICAKSGANTNNSDNYYVKYNKLLRKLIIEKTTFKIPFFMRLEEPVWAEYVPLLPGRKYFGTILSDLPIKTPATNSDNPFTESKTKKLALKIGVYLSDLKNDDNKNFTKSTDFPNSILVSCFYKQPKFITTEIVKVISILLD
jgi:hypothetical protein